jgi:ABC-type sugar transport system permease subunit
VRTSAGFGRSFSPSLLFSAFTVAVCLAVFSLSVVSTMALFLAVLISSQTAKFLHIIAADVMVVEELRGLISRVVDYRLDVVVLSQTIE